jgi:hypothetical protein
MTQAAKYGFCDAVMGRPSLCPWKDFIRAKQYLDGYFYGLKLKGMKQ